MIVGFVVYEAGIACVASNIDEAGIACVAEMSVVT